MPIVNQINKSMSFHNCIPLFILFIIVVCIPLFHHCSPTVDDLYSPAEKCLDSKHHNPSPDRTNKLHNLCHQWSNYSCCTNESSIGAHSPVNHYGFNISHCGQDAISTACREHFIRDLCYYDCDPYVRPWVLSQKRSFAKERIFMVPMCKKDCLKWWDACKSSSFTCVRNWAKHFKWVKNPATNKKTNQCPEEAQCTAFQNIYKDAADFCETVWDNSWRVVNDSSRCIQIEFDGALSNPNKQVAEWYLEDQKKSHNNGSAQPIFTCIFALILFYICYRVILIVYSCAKALSA